MTRTGMGVTLRTRLPALVLILVSAALAIPAQAGSAQAPFGDKVSGAILNYNRATPQIATSGRFAPEAAAEIKALGFATVVELRAQSEKGVAAVAGALKKEGLKYLNIEVTTAAPTKPQVDAFTRVAEDPANYPLLVVCKSANRVGAMWALYRAGQGVDPIVAIEEGRTAGLKPNREGAVRKMLRLPPLTTN